MSDRSSSILSTLKSTALVAGKIAAYGVAWFLLAAVLAGVLRDGFGMSEDPGAGIGVLTSALVVGLFWTWRRGWLKWSREESKADGSSTEDISPETSAEDRATDEHFRESGDWYWVKKDSNQKNGPVSREQLKELAEASDLESEDLVWREGFDDWKEAGSVEEIEELFASPPPLPEDPSGEKAEEPPTLPKSEPDDDGKATKSEALDCTHDYDKKDVCRRCGWSRRELRELRMNKKSKPSNKEEFRNTEEVLYDHKKTDKNVIEGTVFYDFENPSAVAFSFLMIKFFKGDGSEIREEEILEKIDFYSKKYPDKLTFEDKKRSIDIAKEIEKTTSKDERRIRIIRQSIRIIVSHIKDRNEGNIKLKEHLRKSGNINQSLDIPFIIEDETEIIFEEIGNTQRRLRKIDEKLFMSINTGVQLIDQEYFYKRHPVWTTASIGFVLFFAFITAIADTSNETKAAEACEEKVREEYDVVELFGGPDPSTGGAADEDSHYPGSVLDIGNGEYLVDGFVATDYIPKDDLIGGYYGSYVGTYFECKIKVTKDGANVVSFDS